MSEQLYYTWSHIGSGSSAGERIRAQSPGVGSVNSEPVRALMKFLTYMTPTGASLQLTPEEAPISLTYARTGYHTVLVQRVYAGKDGVNRAGNLFSHAILNPEKISQLYQTVPITTQDAIRLWRSQLWLTAEDKILNKDQTPNKSTIIDPLAPQEITAHIKPGWTFNIDQQTVFDWLPDVFLAFLMLKKLNKKQLCLAAPADMVAALIWCITRCLPHSLDIIQDLTFSSYEHDVTKSPVTIVGTCWLPPANHQGGSFIPTYDLPHTCYTDQPTNPILAINCYNPLKKTPFANDKLVEKFVDFATRSLRNNDTKDLDTLIEQAERKNIQDFDTFLVPFRLLNEVPTESTVKQVLTTQALWFCLQFQNIREKLLELFHTEHYFWQSSQAEGKKALQEIHQYAKLNPQSEEAQALKDIAMALLNELIFALTNQQTNDVLFWDLTLKDCSSLESAPDLWITFPKRFAGLAYNAAYQFWWDESGKLIVDYLVSSATTGSRLTGKQRQDLQENMKLWWNQSAECLKGAWNQVEPCKFDSAFWINQLLVLHAPQRGDNSWHTLLEELDRIRPQKKAPVQICNWETYMTLMRIWLYIGYEPSDSWLTIPWQYMPDLLGIPDSEFPVEWKCTALRVNILYLQPPTTQTLDQVARCTPLVHQVIAQLIRDDRDRQYAVNFCTFLLQYKYSQQNQLLSTILPEIFPYEQEKHLIANAAQLTPEQLNSYAEDIIYNHLTTSRDIPDWLLSVLRDYFTNFRAKVLNSTTPQEQEQRTKTHTILDILVKRNSILREDLRPYVSFWFIISNYFHQQQYIFDPEKMKNISDCISKIQLAENARTELINEMKLFLANNVKTEANLIRIIDHLHAMLVPSELNAIEKELILLKDLTSIVGEQMKTPMNIPRTIAYLKVMLDEAILLRNLNNIPQQIIDQFINKCLDNLFKSIDRRQVDGISTSQWDSSIKTLWENSWKNYKTQQPPAKNSLWPPRPQLPIKVGGHLPAQPDPQATIKHSPASTQNSSNNAGKHPLPTNLQQNYDQQPFYQSQPTPQQEQKKQVLPAHGPTQQNPNTQPTNTPIPRNLVGKAAKLQQALNGQQVDAIAKAYDEQLDLWLNPEDKKWARIAREIMTEYTKGKKSRDFETFVTLYNDNRNSFYWPKDINLTLDNLRLEALRNAITNRRIEEIVKYHKDRFESHLSKEDKELSDVALEINKAYDDSIKYNDFWPFVVAYRKHYSDFIVTDKLVLSRDMLATLEQLHKNKML